MREAEDIIERMVRENAFRAAVLTNELGLPLAAFPGGIQSEAPAAMVAQIRRMYDRVHHRVALRDMGEIVLRDDAGQRLVCRRFLVEDYDLILAVLVPPGRRYRQAINETVAEIRECWLPKHDTP